MWPLELEPQQTQAAGAIDPAASWKCPDGYAWHITGIFVIFGAGATAATLYRDAAQPVKQRFNWTATGLWEPRLLLVRGGGRLVVTSAGGGVTVALEGVQIAAHFLPSYLA